MCPNRNSAFRKNETKVENISPRAQLGEIFQYTPPILREIASGWYIEFYAFDPIKRGMHRKRIRINKIHGVMARRKYAREVMQRISEKLAHGWNPFIRVDDIEALTIREAFDRYIKHNEKMLASGYIRKETYDGYKSYMRILFEYAEKHNPIYYCYQFNRQFCTDFLDYVFIDRNNGAQTRNNYLNFLRVLAGFLVEKGYLSSKPTDGIAPISKRLYQKKREVIPADKLREIADWLRVNDPYFLFASYILYYCFVRPVEMTRLKISDFDLRHCTLTLHEEQSKNKREQTVTIPKKVLFFGIDLGIFSEPQSYYLFGANMRPGRTPTTTKVMRDHWAKLRKALRLKSTWTFYSLKDTGITAMLESNLATITVRDQARHSSLAITNIYAGGNHAARSEVLEYEGDF